MTTVDRSRASSRILRQRGHRVVLHVVESWGAGVRAAVLQFVAATPEVEHHLLRGVSRAEFSDDGETIFASVGVLPGGSFGAHRAIRRAVRVLQPDVVHAHSSYAGLFVRTAVRSTPTLAKIASPSSENSARVTPRSRWCSTSGVAATNCSTAARTPAPQLSTTCSTTR